MNWTFDTRIAYFYTPKFHSKIKIVRRGMVALNLYSNACGSIRRGVRKKVRVFFLRNKMLPTLLSIHNSEADLRPRFIWYTTYVRNVGITNVNKTLVNKLNSASCEHS